MVQLQEGSASPVGTSEAGVTLQSSLQLGQGGQNFYPRVNLSLALGCCGKGLDIGEVAFFCPSNSPRSCRTSSLTSMRNQVNNNQRSVGTGVRQASLCSSQFSFPLCVITQTLSPLEGACMAKGISRPMFYELSYSPPPGSSKNPMLNSHWSR